MALKPVTVSQLNGYIKRILQSDPILGNISVIGEISNIKFHSTGHVYFTLKDASSKVNCFLSKDTLPKIRYELSDGMEITASGFIYLFERGGSYSLNISDIEVQGAGNLSVAFEKLKAKLEAEGLFEEKYKKTIPFFPRKIAVVTSGTGAAVQDIIKIIKTKNNIVDVLIYPVAVQGPGAATEIAEAISEINRAFPDIDTIITGRGGGSMEELWAFNEECVARSIFASTIPVISAVGHETDFTIADFVADRRAETPTAAAGLAVPDIGELKNRTEALSEALLTSLKRVVEQKENAVAACSMDALKSALLSRISYNFLQVQSQQNGLNESINRLILTNEARLTALKEGIDALNPLAIIGRGYAAVLHEDGVFAKGAVEFEKNDVLTVVFADGKLDCEIKEKR